MSKELSMDIREKFDTILETVKEPQSELSLAELALVSKISYFDKDKTIIAFMNFSKNKECPACFAVNDLIKQTVTRDLRDALIDAFPGWSIEIQ
ncbi:MAG: hypothetical protein RBT62_08340 [Spirochaetia bacterium]|jgi:metal-sulfur cluster biosynthetic enzyme|nr:hypothetical protein [Spirochaetia bacterium]